MSTPPGGSGWYQASDGRWYPNQPRYAQPPYAQPPYAQPQYGGAPPPGKGSTGKIIAIVVGVLVVLLVLGGLAVRNFVVGVSDRIGGVTEGLGTGCDAVADADVNAALGGTYDVIQLGGIGAFAAPVLDSRVLADAPTCWAVESGGSGGRLARVARYSGSDAAQRFAAEKKQAMGTTEDRGGGLSVSTDAYFNKDVSAGDEAFCTTGDFSSSAGVLVRRGDLLVYVSTTAAGGGAASLPQIEFPADGASPNDAIRYRTDDANCDLATALAAAVR